MNAEEIRAALKRGHEYNRDNANKIRFDPNIPVTVVLPADWISTFKQERKESYQDPEKEYVDNVFYVTNPNSDDPEKLRELHASEKLYDKISEVIEGSIDQDYFGPIIMRIEKKVKGGNTFGDWSVQGNRYEPKSGS